MLPRPKQLKIINHKVNKTMHSTVLRESASLLSLRAIGNILFPTYEAVITSSLHSNDLLFVEKIKCNIPLVDDHRHLPPICKRFVLFFMLNVKNDRLDATDFFFFFLPEYRCNFHFNFAQCNMILL